MTRVTVTLGHFIFLSILGHAMSPSARHHGPMVLRASSGTVKPVARRALEPVPPLRSPATVGRVGRAAAEGDIIGGAGGKVSGQRLSCRRAGTTVPGRRNRRRVTCAILTWGAASAVASRSGLAETRA